MKQFLLLFILITSAKFSAQDYIFGKILNETEIPISGATVINMRTDQFVFSDQSGNFMIAALENDPLRVIKKNYDRVDFKIKNKDFNSPLKIAIISSPELIEEVALAFQPTGNLKNDINKLPKNEKKKRLQDEIAKSLRYKPTETLPTLTVPSAFKPRDLSAGQISLFDSNGGGILGALVGGVTKAIRNKPKISTANYVETKEFLSKLKLNINKNYYYNVGMTDSQLDQFLADAELQLDLAKKYRKDFNIGILESQLRVYLETYKFKIEK